MSTNEGILHRIDAVAATLVARAKPIEFRLAADSADMQTAQRIRAQALLARGRATADELPDGREVAEGDERAVHILAEVRGRPIGTCRLIFPEAGRLLPMEERVGGAGLPRPCVELGRLAVLDQPGAGHGPVMAGMIGAAWLEARRRGEHRICGTVSFAMLRLTRRLGFVLEVLGPEVELLGEPHLPIIFEPTGVVAAAAEAGSSGALASGQKSERCD